MKQQAATLRVGVVGLGWAGQQHLEAYSKIDGVQIVALAGMEEDLLAQLQEQYAVPHAVRTWEELLALPDLDAVSVAVPTFLHAPIAIAALERGLHVLSEKPIARNGDEGQRMVDAARRAGRVLDVAFNHRRRGDIQVLKGIIDRGELGRPYYAKASWVRRSGIPKLGSWFTNKEMAGGGPLADIGVHVLDYALYLLGEPKVLSVSAATYAELGPRGRGGNDRYTALSTNFAYEVEDFASAFIRLEGGTTLVLESGWASYRDEADLMDFSVFGTDGGADLRAVGASNTPVADLRVFTEKDGVNADYTPAAEPGRAHQAVVEDFVATVRAGESVWGAHDGSLALSRARVIDACYQSAAEHREVEL
ncbi:Gfo/Idh/MocA family oxidoreductase [Paenarthrobacter sp. DKR-5]|uniref:Gfo/Idh/MocA family protein n=1 Tax=Paenarthrobacter sp. DKR-5 TaxID=2835535 RepID=UPI001BDD455C|nr:Gfo/Idh/MocA family oxidoreductase [Paenarthrobacter sp. DKR-5]MBT1003458.1 Gfo/Idh/MocA family oxidoreductase [Paenarthrobacter sp. DKR-5]